MISYFQAGVITGEMTVVGLAAGFFGRQLMNWIIRVAAQASIASDQDR
jgi:hypothetical protein